MPSGIISADGLYWPLPNRMAMLRALALPSSEAPKVLPFCAKRVRYSS